jgi:predicted Zn-dependent peptidase
VSARLLAAALLAFVARPAAAEETALEVLDGVDGRPRVVLAQRPGREAGLVVAFGVGAYDDGGLPGITGLSQQVMLNANPGLDLEALRLGVHAAAGELGAQTGQRQSVFWLSAHRADFQPLAQKLLQGLLAPTQDRKKRKEAAAATLMQGGLYGAESLVAAVTAASADDGRYRNGVRAGKAAILALRASDVDAHLARWFQPANATVVVTGSFDRDELLRFVRRFRGGERRGPDRARLVLPILTRLGAAREVHLLAQELKVTTEREAAAARVLAALTQELVWRRFREAGQGYSASADVARFPWIDLLVVVLPGRSDLASALTAAIEDIRLGKFDDRALERARSAALGRMAGEQQRPLALALTLARSGAPWTEREVAETVRQLDRAAFLATTGPWLASAASAHVYFGPNP